MRPDRLDSSDGDSGFSDGSVASITSNKQTNLKIPRSKPNCNKCKNHNVIKPLSGHKRYCAYQNCTCELCILTDERRVVMAAQTRQKRAQLQDERNGLPLEMRAPVKPPRSSTKTPAASPPIKPRKTVLTLTSEPKISRKVKKPVEVKGTMVDLAHRLICEFGVAYTVAPFALALLRRVGSYERVSNIIIDIQEALLEKTRLTASLVHDRPPIFSHGPNYVPEAHTSSLRFNAAYNSSYNQHHVTACGAKYRAYMSRGQYSTVARPFN